MEGRPQAKSASRALEARGRVAREGGSRAVGSAAIGGSAGSGRRCAVAGAIAGRGAADILTIQAVAAALNPSATTLTAATIKICRERRRKSNELNARGAETSNICVAFTFARQDLKSATRSSPKANGMHGGLAAQFELAAFSTLASERAMADLRSSPPLPGEAGPGEGKHGVRCEGGDPGAGDLPVWRKLSVAAFLAAGAADAAAEGLGEPCVDAAGRAHARLLGQLMLIFAASSETLVRADGQAIDRGGARAVCVRAMFATGRDAANRAAFLAEPADAPDLVRPALRGPRDVEKAAKGAALHP